MITIKELYKSYGTQKVYEDFALELEEGSSYALLGPSGCGKTTLLRMIAGLEKYEHGHIKGLEGKRIAYVFQEDRLMPWLSVEENITYVLAQDLNKEIIHEKVTRLLALLQLEDKREAKVQSLSGGMKRRVAIGRALAYESDLLLLDEPFKGLDYALREKVIAGMQQIWALHRPTILCATHDEILAKRLEHQIILK